MHSPMKLAEAAPWPAKDSVQHEPIPSGNCLDKHRALSVLRYMLDELGFPPQRLAAAGFGEFQPVDASGTPGARARNRRIELKLTGQ